MSAAFRFMLVPPGDAEPVPLPSAKEIHQALTSLGPAVLGDSGATFLEGLFHASTHAPVDGFLAFARWLEMDDGRSWLSLEQSANPSSATLSLHLDGGEAFGPLHKERLVRLALKTPTIPGDLMGALAVGLAKVLVGQDRSDEAWELVDALAPVCPSFVVEEMRYALEKQREGRDPGAAFNAYLGGNLTEAFEGKFCDRPFKHLEIDAQGQVFACCSLYISTPIGNVRRGEPLDIWNSPQVRNIRDSIIDGSFKYCRASRCPLIQRDTLQDRDTPEAEGLIRRYQAANRRMEQVEELFLSYDPTCNLYCGSCRKSMIAAKGDTLAFTMHVADNIVLPLLPEAKKMMVNGYGDIFTSQSSRKILASINSTDHPNLKIDMISNGVLLTPEEWAKFPNIHDMVASIRISVDAVKKETYDQVRRGGDFEKLKRNLDFIASLRRDGVIEAFRLSFVFQHENMEEMIEFARWGERLGCDRVLFEPLFNWGTYDEAEYRRRAIHRPDHPDHHRFVEICKAPELRSPLVSLTLPDDPAPLPA
ncbi:MAG: SPASM domain-containing protein [Magnetovibrionaceae bacterium]